MVDAASRIVFFGGAGVSTESGIPDFRSVDGLYSQRYAYPPETMLSHSFFLQKTEEFFDFYKNKMIFPDVQPNAAHKKLAELEAAGKFLAVVTQNIDGLHQKAGSKNVLELHGSVLRNFCMNCQKSYTEQDILESRGVPRCACGGIVKPDVVLYEEPLDDRVVGRAISAIQNADLIIVGGTSLVVYPAAGLLGYRARSTRLALINRSGTALDDTAALVLRAPIGEVLGRIRVN
jgi:NAD-dependent deacetylase